MNDDSYPYVGIAVLGIKVARYIRDLEGDRLLSIHSFLIPEVTFLKRVKRGCE